MSRLHVLLAVTAGLATTSIAHADLFSSINGFAVSPTWYTDYPGATINVTNGGLPSIRFQGSNYPTTLNSYAQRSIGFLSVAGVPFQFDPNQGFQVDTNVTINSSGLNANGAPYTTEAGFTVGTAPNFPSSSLANTGDFHIRTPDGEIAAFGGVNPFFANNNPFNGGNAHPWPTITVGQTYHMTLIYNTSPGGTSMNFGVNGVFTGNLSCSQLLPGSLVGVFAQGPDASTTAPGAVTDVTYANTTIVVPAPASVALLGLGGLVASRRRR